MTITDTPTHRAEPDDTQVLFEEARQRRKRRRLFAGITILIVVATALGITLGLLVSHGSGNSPTPVAPAAPAPSPAAAANTSLFSIRPVLCYAVPYSPTPGQVRSTGSLPACSPPYQLTTSNLQVNPASNKVDGYTVNSNIGADPQFANYPSTTSSSGTQEQDVILPGSSVNGPDRYVLGPVGLTRSAIAGAHVTHLDGQWAIYLALTPRGSAQWDSLAAHQFHAVVGVVVNGQVVSAPITQPTQSSFTSFDGQLQISGGFTEHQAKVIASEL